MWGTARPERLRGGRHRGKDRWPTGPTGRAALPWSRAAVLLALLLIAALAFAAAPGQASHKDRRFGVASPQGLDPAEIARMGQGEVGVVRTDFRWRDVEPLDGVAYNWTRYDALVAQTAANGVELLPVIIGSPFDVAPKNKPPTTPTDLDRYRRFLKALVSRYGRNGDFWCQSPAPIPDCSPNYEPITDYQVWNEPSLKAYWTNNDPDPKEYVKFLEISRKAIESRDEKATIVMAGLPWATGAGMDLKPYLRRVYEVDGARKNFDVVAVHPYGPDKGGVKFILGEVRDLMDSRNDEDTPIWVTEVGWGVDGRDVDREAGFVKSRKGQAETIGETFRMIDNRRDDFLVGTVSYFSWRDYPPAEDEENNYWYRNAGLFEYQSGEPKPAWGAFVNHVGGDPGVGPLPPPTEGPAKTGAIGPTKAEGIRPAPSP